MESDLPVGVSSHTRRKMFQVGTLLPNGKAKNTWFKNKDEAITCRRNYEEQWAFNDLEGELWVDVEETHDKACEILGV